MDLIYDDEEVVEESQKEEVPKEEEKDTTVLLEDADFLDNEQEKMIIHDLMNSRQGRQSITENIAKRCLETLKKEIDIDFGNAGVKILKVDILNECDKIVEDIPQYLLVDDSNAKRLLYKQITIFLGMLIERMLFKYGSLLNNK